MGTATTPIVDALERQMKSPDLVVVGTYRDKMEAEVIRSALGAAQIDSILQGDSVRAPSPWMTGYKVLVRAEDFMEASRILRLSK